MSNKNIPLCAPGDICYKEKKTIFSSKEIIFRSQGRAKVFHISSRAQVIFLTIVLLIGGWSFYSYNMYHRSGNIISTKDKEIGETRDAYVNLMTDFVTLHKNVSSMISSLDQTKGSNVSKDIERYRQQALIVEDKIKQITTQKEWVSPEKISEKISLSEALLQRDIAASERDELKRQIIALEELVENIKVAELEVLDRVGAVASKELDKIKGALSAVNVPLKSKGLYFNALANKKKNNSKGGPYIPIKHNDLKDKKINEKISKIYEDADSLEYYKEVVQYVPIGKPVWSYWVSSPFGQRIDPFRGEGAIHKGLDLASRTGNKIKVMGKGKVTRAEYAGAYGNLVEVDHGNGFRTKYAHLHKIYVKKGDYLEIDDTVGEVGSTGRSTGPHLHYEVLYMGHPVDPMPFIKAKTS